MPFLVNWFEFLACGRELDSQTQGAPRSPQVIFKSKFLTFLRLNTARSILSLSLNSTQTKKQNLPQKLACCTKGEDPPNGGWRVFRRSGKMVVT